MPSIISSLNKPGKKLVRYFVDSLVIVSFLLGIGLTTYFVGKDNRSERQGDILRKLVKKDEESAVDYLKDNLQLVEGIENSRRMLGWLEQILTKPEKKEEKILEKKLNIENEGLIVLDKNIYSSSPSLNEDLIFVKGLDMIFDPQRKSLYKFEGSTLTRVSNNIENVVSFPDKTYFSQRGSIFKKENKEGGKFSRTHQGESNILLRKINGTNLLLVFSRDKLSVLGEEGEDKTKIKSYMRNFLNNTEFKPDNTTKVMFKRGRLYLSNEDHVYSIRGGHVNHVETASGEDFVDYMVKDLDNDEKDEVVLSITNGNVKVYSGEQEKYNIKGGSPIRFDEKTPYRWLNPPKLKKDVKEFLSNLK